MAVYRYLLGSQRWWAEYGAGNIECMPLFDRFDLVLLTRDVQLLAIPM